MGDADVRCPWGPGQGYEGEATKFSLQAVQQVFWLLLSDFPPRQSQRPLYRVKSRFPNGILVFPKAGRRSAKSAL